MKFWDASALVPLCVQEVTTAAMQGVLASDPEPVVWSCSRTEILSALMRRHREGHLTDVALRTARSKRDDLLNGARIVQAFDDVFLAADRLLAIHPLRAADALQLAAALLACDRQPEGHAFLTFDTRLRRAAENEGFDITPTDLDVG